MADRKVKLTNTIKVTIKSRGPQGIQGVQGVQGPQGPKGDAATLDGTVIDTVGDALIFG